MDILQNGRMANHFGEIPDDLWALIEPLLPKQKRGPQGGRPAVEWRQAIGGIMFRLRTGCQWKAMPEEFGSGSTCHRKFQMLEERGVWAKIFRIAAHHYAGKKNPPDMVVTGFSNHQGTPRRR